MRLTPPQLADAAQRTGLSASYIRQICSGASRCSLRAALRIAAATGINPTALLASASAGAHKTGRRGNPKRRARRN